MRRRFRAQDFLMQLAEGKTDLDAITATGAKREAKAAGKGCRRGRLKV